MIEKKPLGVYVHIPFCIRKCRYCDFLSFSTEDSQRKAYVDSLCQEIIHFFREQTDYKVTSVYLGGGTPSLLNSADTTKILDTLFQTVQMDAKVEITTEANPGTLTREKLLVYQKAGINRISLGLQSTVKEELDYLGRIHSYEDFLASYEMAREAGFTNINVDLMSAVPFQTLSSWELTLDRVLALSPEHISAYSLIVEPGTPFYEQKDLDVLLPDEDTEREMYELTEKKLLEQGYYRYEISNYAKKGKECRHNLIYWDRNDYIGFGLGAASCLGNVRFSNTEDFSSYLEKPWTDLTKRREREELSLREQMEETMILGLRKTEGVSERKFFLRYHRQMEEVFGDVISHYEKEGLLIREKGRLHFTKRGLDLSNVVLCEFLS